MYHLAPFVLNVITTSRPVILPFVVFPKALFSALYSSSCTLPLSVLLNSKLTYLLTYLSLPFPLNFYADETQLFFSFHSLNFDFSIFYLRNALQHISSWMTANLLLLTPIRLNSCWSDSKTNLPKYTTLHLTPPSLLEMFALSWTNILLSLTKLDLSPKPVTITFVCPESGGGNERKMSWGWGCWHCLRINQF